MSMAEPYYDAGDVTIYHADARTAHEWLPERSAHAIVTSPPYFGLRDYGDDGQIGLEESPQDYIDGLADLLTGYGERVLKPAGSLWLNLGDSYSSGNGAMRMGSKESANDVARVRRASTEGLPPKCLLMIPERVALALIERGWILRNKVVWAKPNGMPASVQDRLATKWEYVFHLVRQQRYHYDLDAIREKHDTGERVMVNRASADVVSTVSMRRFDEDRIYANNPAGKNPGDWWVIPTQPYPGAHFAVYPSELIRRPILATVPEGGTVCDPFFGSGTTGVMARRLGRKTVGVELSEDYCRLAAKRFREQVLDFGGAA